MAKTEQNTKGNSGVVETPTMSGLMAAVARTRDHSAICSHCGRSGHEKKD